MTEYRSNWEPDWLRTPAERSCRFCRRSLMHSKAEHDLVYDALWRMAGRGEGLVEPTPKPGAGP